MGGEVEESDEKKSILNRSFKNTCAVSYPRPTSLNLQKLGARAGGDGQNL